MTQTNVQRFLGMTITGSKSLPLTKIVYSFMIISEHARFMEHTNFALGNVCFSSLSAWTVLRQENSAAINDYSSVPHRFNIF